MDSSGSAASRAVADVSTARSSRFARRGNNLPTRLLGTHTRSSSRFNCLPFATPQRSLHLCTTESQVTVTRPPLRNTVTRLRRIRTYVRTAIGSYADMSILRLTSLWKHWDQYFPAASDERRDHASARFYSKWFYIFGDNGFKLLTWLMTPFTKKQETAVASRQTEPQCLLRLPKEHARDRRERVRPLQGPLALPAARTPLQAQARHCCGALALLSSRSSRYSHCTQVHGLPHPHTQLTCHITVRSKRALCCTTRAS